MGEGGRAGILGAVCLERRLAVTSDYDILWAYMRAREIAGNTDNLA